MSVQSLAALADGAASPLGNRAAGNVGIGLSEAVELCVLAELLALPYYGGLPESTVPLAPDDRRERLATLLALWTSGCRRAIDERLFSDLLHRYPSEAKAYRIRARNARE